MDPVVTSTIAEVVDALGFIVPFPYLMMVVGSCSFVSSLILQIPLQGGRQEDGWMRSAQVGNPIVRAIGVVLVVFGGVLTLLVEAAGDK